MNNYYTDRCNKLEKSALKRRIYYGVSESSVKLIKKNSKLNESYSGNVLIKNTKEKDTKHPFICAGSANKSYHIGINMQTAMSIVKQFPRKNIEEMHLSLNSSDNFIMGSRESETSISQQFKDMQMCPARSEDQLVIEEDETCNGVIPDPWAVKQADDIDVFGCGHKKKSCKCPTRSMDSYSKVMAPFVQHWSRKKNTDKNPFTKSKNILLYEQQSRHMEELKMTTIAMNNSFSAKKKKYQKLYEQYVRTQNSKLITVLLQLEDELNDLTCALKEAIDVYKEAAFINKPETNSSNCLLDHIENPPTPKETTTVRLIKNLRRLQELQEKLKNGHFFQGSGDNMG